MTDRRDSCVSLKTKAARFRAASLTFGAPSAVRYGFDGFVGLCMVPDVPPGPPIGPLVPPAPVVAPVSEGAPLRVPVEVPVPEEPLPAEVPDAPVLGEPGPDDP